MPSDDRAEYGDELDPATRTVETPIDDALRATCARAARRDPDATDVVDAAVRDGKLAVEVAGERA